MLKKYIIVIAFFVGIITGMVQTNLIMPTASSPNTPYYHGVRGNNNIALTINVDWGEEYLKDMLQVLHNNNVKVTFFVTGKWANKNQDLLKLMSDLGHEIGNHGYSHAHPKQLTNEQLIDLIKKNEDLINQITNKRTNLFAPPYGEVDDRIASVANSIGYSTIMWSADTIDWQRPPAEVVAQRAINKIDDGGIILMHPTQPSLDALDRIITTLKGRDYNFVTISELINK
ncbi:polysaccharide deacetylase family protein [Natronospora cellulosivora (SeqCode)]